MEWVTVEDEYGKDPALRFPGTTVIAFPLTMISKSDRARRKGGRCRAVRRSLWARASNEERSGVVIDHTTESYARSCARR